VDTIFTDFKNGKYDIMVGTQIVAKGWDFSNVDLIGVINSDIGLMLPDFRASERTFSLLKQVQGRAGRGQNRGKIIVQTYNPTHYSIKSLFEKNYKGFFEEEMKIRNEAGFPPFLKLISILSSHKSEKVANKNIYICRDYIRNNMKDVSILGPSQAPIYRVRGMYRWQLLIKFNKEKYIKIKLKEMLIKKKFTGRLKIDVDPQDMM